MLGENHEDLASADVENIINNPHYAISRGVRQLEDGDPSIAQKIFFAYAYFGQTRSDEWIIRTDEAPFNQGAGTYVERLNGKITRIVLVDTPSGLTVSKKENLSEFNPQPYIDSLVKRVEGDKAMVTAAKPQVYTAMKAPTGGIDLTPANNVLQTPNAGQAIKFHIDAAQLAKLQNAPGFVPVIISIKPMVDTRLWLGITPKANDKFPRPANDNQPPLAMLKAG